MVLITQDYDDAIANGEKFPSPCGDYGSYQ